MIRFVASNVSVYIMNINFGEVHMNLGAVEGDAGRLNLCSRSDQLSYLISLLKVFVFHLSPSRRTIL
jgi:hypothetical protein